MLNCIKIVCFLSSNINTCICICLPVLKTLVFGKTSNWFSTALLVDGLRKTCVHLHMVNLNETAQCMTTLNILWMQMYPNAIDCFRNATKLLEHYCSWWFSLVKTSFTRTLRLCNAFYEDWGWISELVHCLKITYLNISGSLTVTVPNFGPWPSTNLYLALAIKFPMAVPTWAITIFCFSLCNSVNLCLNSLQQALILSCRLKTPGLKGNRQLNKYMFHWSIENFIYQFLLISEDKYFFLLKSQ